MGNGCFSDKRSMVVKAYLTVGVCVAFAVGGFSQSNDAGAKSFGKSGTHELVPLRGSVNAVHFDRRAQMSEFQVANDQIKKQSRFRQFLSTKQGKATVGVAAVAGLGLLVGVPAAIAATTPSEQDRLIKIIQTDPAVRARFIQGAQMVNGNLTDENMDAILKYPKAIALTPVSGSINGQVYGCPDVFNGPCYSRPIEPLIPTQAEPTGEVDSSGSQCYHQQFGEVSEDFYGKTQWGITLDKRWCGNKNGITSQDKDVFVYTAPLWNERDRKSSTKMYSSKHGSSKAETTFYCSIGGKIGITLKKASPAVGIDFWNTGVFSKWWS